MTRRPSFRTVRLFLPLALFLLVACGRAPVHVPDINRADSLLQASYRARDFAGMLALTDSLSVVGDLSPVKTAYWRGYAHSRLGDRRQAESCWSEALTLGFRDPDDMAYYARSANRLSDMLLLKGEYESTLRIALPAIAKMREAGIAGNGDYAHLLVSVGSCELHLGDLQTAQGRFEQAYDIFLQLLDGENGSQINNHTSAMAGLTTITDNCLWRQCYADALVWVERMEDLLDGYRRQSEATEEYVDRQQARVKLYSAWALEGLDRHKEAADSYDEALSTRYAHTGEGRMEAVSYLMLAGRWNEAADNFRLLDTQMDKYGFVFSLDNILRFLLPKFRTNMQAHRDGEALAVGSQIVGALDSAIIWNREDKAAEMATLYRTQELEQQYLEQKARGQRSRFLASLAVLVLLVIIFTLLYIIRFRISRRLEAANRQLEAANARAEESSRVKTAFLQQISHEIRTPLNMLSGFAQVLTTPELDLDDESRAQIKAGVIDNTDRITSLISKILDLSDLVSTTVLEKNDRVAASRIAAEATDASGVRANPNLRFEVRGGEDILLHTNGNAAAHVLVLLLENAQKYTESGRVALRVETRQDFVDFVVEDTGIGIPPEQSERIFEQFVQLDDYREGTGIGLSVARSIARRLGGDIRLDTTYTGGARFLFSLPLGE